MATLLFTHLLINSIQHVAWSHEIDCTEQYCGSVIQCDPSDECTVKCEEGASCNGATINCPSNEDCSVYCEGENACAYTTIKGPSSSNELQVYCSGSDSKPCSNLDVVGGAGSTINVDCSGESNACSNSIFRASTASSFTLSDCTESNSCIGVSVYCPPNVNGNAKCTLQGNNQLGGTSSSPMTIYAINSWLDVAFKGSKSNHFVGTMYCTADLSASCAIDDVSNQWQCRDDDASSECGDGQQEEDSTSSTPTNAPSLRPTGDPLSVPSPVTISPVTAPTPYPSTMTSAPSMTPTGTQSVINRMPSIVVTLRPTTSQGIMTGVTPQGGNVQIVDPEEVIDAENPVMGNLVLLLAATAVVLCVCFCCLVLCVVRKQKKAKMRWRTRRQLSAQAVMSSIVGHKKVESKAKDHRHGTPGKGRGGHSDSDSEDSSDTEHDIEVSMEIGMLDHNGKKRPSVQPHGVEYGASIHYFDHHEECPQGIARPSTRAAEPSDDELAELEEEEEVDPTDSGERLSQELWREDQEGDILIVPGEDDVVIGSPTMDECPQNGDDAPRLLLPPTKGGDHHNASDDDEEVPPPPIPFPLRKTPNGDKSSDEEEVPPAPGPPQY